MNLPFTDTNRTHTQNPEEIRGDCVYYSVYVCHEVAVKSCFYDPPKRTALYFLPCLLFHSALHKYKSG